MHHKARYSSSLRHYQYTWLGFALAVGPIKFSVKKKESLSFFIKTMELLKSLEESDMVTAQGTETISGK